MLVHWQLMGGLLHLTQRGGDWAGPQPAHDPPRCIKCNSPPINGQCTNIISLYNGLLLRVIINPLNCKGNYSATSNEVGTVAVDG